MNQVKEMPQALSVKRAQVEWHQFASLGEPERAMAAYYEENVRRGSLLRKHRTFAGELTPFLEIGANAGHSSYMLANEFAADGFALDISADALRNGIALMDAWGLPRAMVRVAGDAVHLPFADGSLSFVCAFQMLSQFMDIESVFIEVKRVLRPGGVFFFAEEPVRRALSLRLYRAPYERSMKPWERKLHQWGLLGYLVRDVIGAAQEEGFGIRQNHRMGLADWDQLIAKHFEAYEYELFPPKRGWGEAVVHWFSSQPARWLGGTMAAFCRKAGSAAPAACPLPELLRCPDCRSPFRRDGDTLRCTACPYEAPDEGGVYNLLPSADKTHLYPGPRADRIDFAQSPCDGQLLGGFYEVEGSSGNFYRWMGPQAKFRLERVDAGPQQLRIRGYASEDFIAQGRIALRVNGAAAGQWRIDRAGVFVLETPVPNEAVYEVEVTATPHFQVPGDDRRLTVNLSLMRLTPR